MIIFFQFFLLATSISLGSTSSVAILLSLKQSVEDPLHTLESWTSNNSLCNQWSGITCSDQGHVTDLHLQSLLFKSPSVLFSSINQLQELRVLDLSMNQFSGSFSMPNNKLQKLRLSSNNFTFVAIHSCQNLIELDITMNIVSEEFYNLQITDSCPSLKFLNISSNKFSGYFPKVLASFPSLEVVDASFNSFSGVVPNFHSKYLKHLNLSSNNFTAIAKSFCARSPEVINLILVNNRITKALHKVMNCRRLSMLDVSFNSLAEEIPKNICNNLPHLAYLLAWVNYLHGELPANLAACSNLTIIFLNHNNLTGSIPPELFQLETLKWISLSNNKLTGTIPYINLYNLSGLQLANNLLEGRLPERLTMEMVELQNNKLTGAIPSRWGYAETKFHTGKYLSSLKVVVLQKGIPQETCVEEVMALQGIKLNTATQRLVSRTGCIDNVDVEYISSAFMNYSRSPFYIDIRYNRLEGNIPEDIGNMQDLVDVNFAHNLFTGGIPESFGKLKKLMFLNISHNGLSGSIPASISQLTFLSTLDVSYNKLSGRIPPSAQFSTLDPQGFEGNPGLCGSPLSVPCNFISGNANPHQQFSSPGHGKKGTNPDFGIVLGVITFFISFFIAVMVIVTKTSKVPFRC